MGAITYHRFLLFPPFFSRQDSCRERHGSLSETEVFSECSVSWIEILSTAAVAELARQNHGLRCMMFRLNRDSPRQLGLMIVDTWFGEIAEQDGGGG